MLLIVGERPMKLALYFATRDNNCQNTLRLKNAPPSCDDNFVKS